MLAIGTTIWVLVLMGLLHLAQPTPEMRREPSTNGTVYAVWAVLSALLLTIHYVLMAQAGLGTLALVADAAAVAIYVAVQAVSTLRRVRRARHASGTVTDSLQ